MFPKEKRSKLEGVESGGEWKGWEISFLSLACLWATWQCSGHAPASFLRDHSKWSSGNHMGARARTELVFCKVIFQGRQFMRSRTIMILKSTPKDWYEPCDSRFVSLSETLIPGNPL